MKKVFLLAALIVAAATARAADPSADMTYLSLGDSYAYGYTDGSTTVSFGDQGYVRPYADWLAAQNGGVRPRVLNLAVCGETTGSFFAGNNPLAFLNLNYADPATMTLGANYTSQAAALQARIAQERAAGRRIGPVTVQLGGNDLIALVTAPGFLDGETLADHQRRQQALVQALGSVQENYTSLLTLLRREAPEADLMLLGYMNPYAGLDPAHPFHALSFPLTQGLNTLIAGQAAAFGARYVDLYTPFVGREREWTHIGDPFLPDSLPNNHPNAAGYEVIAGRLRQASGTASAAAVPEPGTALLAALGAFPACLGFVARRRRAEASAE